MDAGRHDSLADQLMELHTLQEARIAAEEEARLKAAEDARRRAEAAAAQHTRGQRGGTISRRGRKYQRA